MTQNSSHAFGSEAYRDLLALNGRAFVNRAYSSILNRPVDYIGGEFYLKRLLSGAQKLQLLKELRQSSEGQAVGLSWPVLDRWIRRWESAQGFFGWFVRQRHGLDGQNTNDVRLRSMEQLMHVMRIDLQATAAELAAFRWQTESFDAAMIDAMIRAADTSALDGLLAALPVGAASVPSSPRREETALAAGSSPDLSLPLFQDKPIAFSARSPAEAMAHLQASLTGSREASRLRVGMIAS